AHGLAVTLGPRDFAQIRGGVVMITRRHSRARFETADLQECPKLPANVCPFSPILKLLPHDARFDEEPVILIIRVCTGAQVVWRSTSNGNWESLQDVEFYLGHAVLRLNHFCNLFVGSNGASSPERKGILVRGFMDGTTRRGKCAVLHANCSSCTEQLESTSDYRADPEVLKGFDECGPSFCAGLYSHGDRLTIAQAHHYHQDTALNFNRFPLVTSRCFQTEQFQFEVDIADTVHAFRATQSLPVGPENVYTAEEPHIFLSTGELEAGRLPIAELLQRAHADSGKDAELLLQVVPPPPPPPLPQEDEHRSEVLAQPPPPPPVAKRTNMMVSGRFNDQQKMNYMRHVKELLQERSVPVDMVKANFASATFGDQTAQLLYKAKALLPFCTWDYGAKTGIGYETYIELEYAHQKGLAILPIQLCHEFPPCPTDEEGRVQNALVLKSDLVRIIDKDMSDPKRVAQEICDAWFGAIQYM
ncbi:unnamed protein product, partial [Symbiodinium necroappetens]